MTQSFMEKILSTYTQPMCTATEHKLILDLTYKMSYKFPRLDTKEYVNYDKDGVEKLKAAKDKYSLGSMKTALKNKPGAIRRMGRK